MCSSMRTNQAIQSLVSGENWPYWGYWNGLRSQENTWKAFFVVPTGWNHSVSREDATQSILNHTVLGDTWEAASLPCHTDTKWQLGGYLKRLEQAPRTPVQHWKRALKRSLALAKVSFIWHRWGSGKNTSLWGKRYPNKYFQGRKLCSFHKVILHHTIQMQM